jgi:hypothetical protein
MSEGELAAAFEGLAEDTAQAGGEIAESIAKFTDDTANIEDANVARTLAADADAARAAAAIAEGAGPESGLNGGAEAGGGSVGPSSGEGISSEVESFVNRARNAEPKLTSDMKEISETVHGSELTGLEFRLKGQGSLARKVETDLLDHPDMSTAEAISRIKDSVRYTMTIPEDSYAQGVNDAVSQLQARDYANISWKDTWGSEGYKGINSTWRDPMSGQLFEVQFHTPASFDAKMVTHALYEKIRIPGVSADVRQLLLQEQRQIFADVPIPQRLPMLRQP